MRLFVLTILITLLSISCDRCKSDEIEDDFEFKKLVEEDSSIHVD